MRNDKYFIYETASSPLHPWSSSPGIPLTRIDDKYMKEAFYFARFVDGELDSLVFLFLLDYNHIRPYNSLKFQPADPKAILTAT